MVSSLVSHLGTEKMHSKGAAFTQAVRGSIGFQGRSKVLSRPDLPPQLPHYGLTLFVSTEGLNCIVSSIRKLFHQQTNERRYIFCVCPFFFFS